MNNNNIKMAMGLYGRSKKYLKWWNGFSGNFGALTPEHFSNIEF